METDRKTRIIKAAVKRFARHGMNKTTLDEIARDLRIGKSSIYHYFKSKEELFYESLEYDASLFTEDIKQILNNENLLFNERLAEYFNYKQQMSNRYKLLHDLILRVLKEESLEIEKEIIKKLIISEEEILSAFFKSSDVKKTESAGPDLSEFLSLYSWGITIGKKLIEIKEDNSNEKLKDMFLISIKSLTI